MHQNYEFFNVKIFISIYLWLIMGSDNGKSHILLLFNKSWFFKLNILFLIINIAFPNIIYLTKNLLVKRRKFILYHKIIIPFQQK